MRAPTIRHKVSWISRPLAPLLAGLWFEAGLVYSHLRSNMILTLPLGLTGLYPKIDGALLLPEALTVGVLLFEYFPAILMPRLVTVRAVSTILLSITTASAIAIDGSAYFHQEVGLSHQTVDLKFAALALALLASWLAMRALLDDDIKTPPTRTALAGTVSGSVIALVFAGPARLALFGALIALLAVSQAIRSDRRR